MIKSVLKEIIITLLLCIAILLILSILFYDYNPLNKIVPNKIAYSTPEEIKNEIEQNDVKDILDGGVNIVYSIDSLDLNIYKKSNSYVPGKANPFAEIPEEVAEDETGSGQVSVKNEQTTVKNEQSSGTITNTNKNPDSTGIFLNNTGAK